MNTRLDTALQSLAGEAGAYGDPDRAIRAAQRRRVRSLVVAPLAIVLVIAVAVVAFVTFDVRRDSSPPAKPPTYPSKIDPPGSSTPDLPTTPVGRGLMVYSPCQGCPAYLLTGSGQQYKLPGNESTLGTLSPDGMWLVLRGERSYSLWNLVDGGMKSLTANTTWHWSSDSSRLLVTADNSWAMLDPKTGKNHPVKMGEEYWAPILLLSTDELVIAPSYGEGESTKGGWEQLFVVDPKSGQKIRELTIDPRPILGKNESVMGRRGLHVGQLGNESEILIRTHGDTTAAIMFSLEDGRTITRFDLPGTNTRTNDYWSIVALTGTDLIATHIRPGEALELVMLDLLTRKQRVTTTLPVNAQIYGLATSGG